MRIRNFFIHLITLSLFIFSGTMGIFALAGICALFLGGTQVVDQGLPGHPETKFILSAVILAAGIPAMLVGFAGGYFVFVVPIYTHFRLRVYNTGPNDQRVVRIFIDLLHRFYAINWPHDPLDSHKIERDITPAPQKPSVPTQTKQLFILRITPKSWHPKIIHLGFYAFLLGALPLWMSAIGGFFAIPYFYIHVRPEAPISHVFLYGLHKLGAFWFMLLYSALLFLISTFFSVGLSLMQLRKIRTQTGPPLTVR